MYADIYEGIGGWNKLYSFETHAEPARGLNSCVICLLFMQTTQ